MWRRRQCSCQPSSFSCLVRTQHASILVCSLRLATLHRHRDRLGCVHARGGGFPKRDLGLHAAARRHRPVGVSVYSTRPHNRRTALNNTRHPRFEWEGGLRLVVWAEPDPPRRCALARFARPQFYSMEEALGHSASGALGTCSCEEPKRKKVCACVCSSRPQTDTCMHAAGESCIQGQWE